MRRIIRVLAVAAVAAGTITVSAPAAHACVDSPNCVSYVVCVGGEAVNKVASAWGLGEPIPCD